jgi:hypothetical protein
LDLEPAHVEMAIAPDGRFAVARTLALNLGTPFPGSPIYESWLNVYGPDGTPLSINTDLGGGFVDAAAMSERGDVLVVWRTLVAGGDDQVDENLLGRIFGADGQPIGPPFPLASQTLGDQLGAIATSAGNDWAVAWVSEPPGEHGGNLFARRFSTCGGTTAHCLAGRFRVEVDWRIPGSGQSGEGMMVPLTQDTGAFWFFSPENPELLIKVLNGSAVNGHFWVFLGALSDVEFEVTVTDMETGAERAYHNPAGTIASRADLEAFPAIAGDTKLGLAAARLPRSSARETRKLIEPPCFESPENLCLGPLGNYLVEVDWRIPATGEAGSGQAAPLTGDAGTFWFFGPDNVELLVKIRDGTPVNGHVWVFYASLTNVEFTLRVINKAAAPEQVRTYHNPAGQMASRADTEAF